MSTARLRIVGGAYRDSLLLLSATRQMRQETGVEWATAVMALPANVADLTAAGFPPDDLDGADANDLVLAVRAADDARANAALDRGGAVLFAEPSLAADGTTRAAPQTITTAVSRLAAANVAVVSVPGPYAALAAHQALTAGLHVLLFSDNVSVEQEIGLKQRANALGRLLMGPGAGTAVLGGVGLGFANSVSRGRVGVVAAAGTGAQEVMTLLDRWGVGVSHVIGVGGRDLSARVAGLMAASAVRALDADPGTDAVLLVSKPPDPGVVASVLAQCPHKPLVCACVGMTARQSPLPGITFARTLEGGAAAVAEQLGTQVPDMAAGLADAADAAIARLGQDRMSVRAFYAGGTLCYEAQVVLTELLGPVCSNIPLAAEYGLPAPAGAHVCLDVGEEEYTRGRPHPMIDPAARREIMQEQAFGDEVAVVLLDVVLGYGSHPDPAGVIAGTCAEIVGAGAAVVAYVLGTDADPQGYSAQCARLTEAGAIVTGSAARAACTAAAIAARRPALAETGTR